jgi:hypothetical protein
MVQYFHLKLGISYGYYEKLTRIITKFGNDNFKLFKYSKTLVYTEESIDSDFAAENEWTPITSKKMASKFFNYIVVGQNIKT